MCTWLRAGFGAGGGRLSFPRCTNAPTWKPHQHRGRLATCGDCLHNRPRGGGWPEDITTKHGQTRRSSGRLGLRRTQDRHRGSEARQRPAEAKAGRQTGDWFTVQFELLSPKLCRRKLFRSLQTHAVSTMVLTYANSAPVMKAADGHSPILSNARC